jgi:hypothetical protein
MSITVNVTEGNKVTVHRQDPISVSLNTTVNNEVTIQKTPPVSITVNRQEGSKINITQQANVSVGIQRQDPISISIDEPGKSSSVTTWGSIGGTITNQTDLVNYITSRLPDVPFETVSDIVNALNNLDEFRLQSSVDFRPANFGIGDEANEYTFPSPLTASEKYGYFLFSDSNGVLQWKLFPLDFITGFDEGAKVDGGTF